MSSISNLALRNEEIRQLSSVESVLGIREREVDKDRIQGEEGRSALDQFRSL